MELLVKIVIDFKLPIIFAKKIHFRCVTGSEFASDYNKSNVFLEQQNSYITVFCNGDSYCQAGIWPAQIQQYKQ